jgi:ribosome-associated protein
MPDEILDDTPYDLDTPLPPSKSQRKREATALQELGERLVKLTTTQLNRTPLPEDLLASVRTAQGISQRGGRKRQLQYIGKLMRQLDEAEIEAIYTALATMQITRR